MVKLRLLGRRLGGVGGLMKDGDAGAEVFFSFFATAGRGAVGLERRLLSEVDVLIPRFFKFLGFFAGVVGLCNSKKVLGEFSDEPLSILRDLKSATKEEGAALAMGDSGDGPGEGSVTEDESIVEMVVVGELSEDSDANVEVLSRCTWKAEKDGFAECEPVGMFPLEAGRPIWLPWEAVPLRSDRSLSPVLLPSSPKTDMNDGMCGANVLELA